MTICRYVGDGPSMTKRDHRQYAFHEAGHAIARIMHGYEVIGLQFHHDHAAVDCESKEDVEIDHEEELFCILAGCVAQCMFAKTKWSVKKMLLGSRQLAGNASDDFYRAEVAARLLRGFSSEQGTEEFSQEGVIVENVVLPDIVSQVQERLETHWHLVEAVANILDKDEFVGQEEFYGIVATAFADVR